MTLMDKSAGKQDLTALPDERDIGLEVEPPILSPITILPAWKLSAESGNISIFKLFLIFIYFKTSE